MQRALELAEHGRLTVAPNPMVGAVIVQNGEIVGEGYHARVGGPHAEIVALAEAGDRARKATIYVTLEPCSHMGRTPPCANALVAAGIERVVCAMIDPNPVVQGRGVALLRAAGVDVVIGLLEPEARALNAAFVVAQCAGRPMVTVKLATSLDGRIATRTGHSQWISGELARDETHKMRARAGAILAGTGTVVADDPRLTARPNGELAAKQPLRVVLDRTLRTDVESTVYDTSVAPTLVFAAEQASAEARRALVARGVEVVSVDSDEHHLLDLSAVLAELLQRGVNDVFVEGGGSLTGSLFDHGLVDRLVQIIAPIIIGGHDSRPGVGGRGVDVVDRAPRARAVRYDTIGDDLLIVADFSTCLTTPLVPSADKEST
ncbi:MAG: diaminohydroxyphosphoribosylaminopyrimidine deaminase [Bradymonadia bacterium]|jgi:diaminohydroxyphosphoribosylaminopyrimidine deaminase/5-amino-6-(5-phosphoribosylamino)uracil reductase